MSTPMSTKPTTIFYQTLFADAARAGIYQLPQNHHQELEVGAGLAACCVFHVDLAKARNKEDLLEKIGRAMAFPEWFGHNWDALYDCLLDMGWRPALGFVVILKNAEMVQSRAETDFTSLLKVFADAADERRANDVPLWCLVEIDAKRMPKLRALPAPPQLA